MSLVQPQPGVYLSADMVTAEEKKRPASTEYDNAGPPLKKQATAMNGATRPHPDTDMPWKENLEVCPSVLDHLITEVQS